MNKEEKDSLTEAKLLRIKAEAKLKAKQKKTGSSKDEHDNKKLLHELQVHQIELEMQNEELQVANEATELALKKYTMLYDLAPMGYFTLDRDGSILELNFTGADILGERRFSLVKSNFRLFVSDDTKDVFNDFFNRVFSSNYKEYCVIDLETTVKPLTRVYIEGVVAGDDKNCLLSVVDISHYRL